LKGRDYLVIWPVYFDLNRSRSEGRKVAKKYAIPNPSLRDLVEAIKKLGLEHIVEENKYYPKFWWLYKGRVLVKKREPKSKLLKKIGEILRSSYELSGKRT